MPPRLLQGLKVTLLEVNKVAQLVSPQDLDVVYSIPYRLVDGTEIASSYANLVAVKANGDWLNAPITRDENGIRNFNVAGVYTNVTPEGFNSNDLSAVTSTACNNWSRADNDGHSFGRIFTKGARWTYGDSRGSCRSNEFHLYCFEQ